MALQESLANKKLDLSFAEYLKNDVDIDKFGTVIDNLVNTRLAQTGFKPNGHTANVGIDIDLLKAISEDQDFKYELDPLGFNAAVAALESNQTDAVIAGMSITPERQKKYDFSEPYYDSGVVMAVSASSDAIKSYQDLAGKKVAVKTGTEGATFAESIKDKYSFQLVYFDESPMMYEDVKTGNSVACFEDYPVMGYGIAQGNGLKMVTDMEKGSSYGFAVMKGKNTELLDKFNAGLKNIKENGKYQEILDKYISAK